MCSNLCSLIISCGWNARGYQKPRINTFTGSLQLQRQLISDYEDITKYARYGSRPHPQCFQAYPISSGKGEQEIPNFTSVHGSRTIVDVSECWTKRVGECLLWLSFPELPLKGNYDATKYKLYLSDTGLLVSMLDDEAQDDLRANKNLVCIRGSVRTGRR